MKKRFKMLFVEKKKTNARLKNGKEKKNFLLKVRTSLTRICQKCRFIRRRNQLLVICSNPKHKQRQG